MRYYICYMLQHVTRYYIWYALLQLDCPSAGRTNVASYHDNLQVAVCMSAGAVVVSRPSAAALTLF